MMEHGQAQRARWTHRSWRTAGAGLCTAATLILFLAAGEAVAATGEWQAGGRLGAAWLDSSGIGPALETYLRRGLSESFDLDVQVLTSLHPFQSDSKVTLDGTSVPLSVRAAPGWALTVSPGLVYRWDVLRAIPYIGAGIGAYAFGEGVGGRAANDTRKGESLLQFGASGRIGLDYLLSRSLVSSVQASAHVVVADGSLRMPWFEVGFGLGHSWGW
jgi:hypothetical protein